MYCDKLYVLKDGKVVASGPPNDILTSKLVRDVYEIDCTIKEDDRTGYLGITYYPHCQHA